MNSLINKIKYEFREPIPKFGAIILIVVGLIMGTVFIFGMYYWEGSVPKSETIFVKATYASYTEEYMGRGRSYTRNTTRANSTRGLRMVRMYV